MTDTNLDIAALLLDLSEAYRPSPKFWGYKNASRSIRRHPEFLADLTDREILKIPGVGPASLRVVREYLDTGASPTVERVTAANARRSRRAGHCGGTFCPQQWCRRCSPSQSEAP